MNRKNNPTEKLLTFLEGKGFYLAVLFCVAVVGFSGWLLARNMIGMTDNDISENPANAAATAGGIQTGNAEVAGTLTPSDAPVSGSAGISVSPSPIPASPSPSPTTLPPTQSATPKPSSNSGHGASAPKAETGMTTQVPLVYTWPVKGEVLGGHSGDKLVYNQTMGDWRVHSGMDIAAAPGTNVLSTAAGTVTAVEQNDLMGTTVVIDHGEGIISRYSNLQEVPTVEVGDKVYTGSIIGAVGKTAIAESSIASHLHFELARDGQHVDPMEYLPKP